MVYIKKSAVLIFIVSISFLHPFSSFVYAQNVGSSLVSEEALLLSPVERSVLFGLIQRELTNSDFYFWSVEKQAALFSARAALRDKNISFLPGFVATETIKVVLSVASSVKKLSEQSIAVILDELEKKSIEVAVDYIDDWLFQNGIKRASGNLGDDMQYIMVVGSSQSKEGQLVLEIFSSSHINPPSGQAGWGYTSPYPGLPKGEKLRPFLLKFSVDILNEKRIEFLSSPSIEISFPSEVPRLQLAKELPYPIEEQKINILNSFTALKKVSDVFLGDAETESFNNFWDVLVGLPGDILGKLADGAYSDYSTLKDFSAKTYRLLIRNSDAGLVDLQANEDQLAGTAVSEGLTEASFAEIERILDRVDQGLDKIEQDLYNVEIQLARESTGAIESLKDEVKESIKEDESAVLSFAGCSEGQINLNSENSEVLENITSIGQVRAAAIIKERAEQPFYTLEDIVRVSGIGEGVLSNITEEGLACVAEPSKRFFVEENESQTSSPVSPFQAISGGGRTVDEEVVGECVNINTASEDSLQSIIHIGPALAQQIVELRSETLFSSVSEMEERVSGIGLSKMADILDQDLACVGEEAPVLNEEEVVEEEVTEEEVTEEEVVEEEATGEEASQAVLINEIAWMGTTASTSSHEWMELYNPGAEDIDLTGWKLEAEDGTPTIELAGTVAAAGYFLLEKTSSEEDSDPVSDITADQTYSGVLHNDGELLYLRNDTGELIDKVDASSNWFAGSASPYYISMERIDKDVAGSEPSNWANNNLLTHNGENVDGGYINGTPGAINSVSVSLTTISSLRLNEFDSITLTKLGSPYRTQGHIIVPTDKTLRVEPGVTVEFGGRLTIEGTLSAVGSQADEILFTNNALWQAIWCGIHFTATSLNSELNYTRVKDASGAGTGCNAIHHYAVFVEESSITMKNSVIELGSGHRKLNLKNSDSIIDAVTLSGATTNNDSAAIYINGGSPTIQNSTISDSSIGIHSDGGLTTPTIQNNTFTGNTYPVKLSSSGAALSGNTATGNTYNGILAEGLVYYTDVIWKADLPYIVSTFTVQEGKTLTLEPGVIIKFAELFSAKPAFTVNGTLLSQGTLENPVLFTRIGDDTAGGDTNEGGINTLSWKRIWFTPTSTGSILQHTKLSYGGSFVSGEGILSIEGEVELQDVAIQNGPYYGIYLLTGGNVTGNSISLTDNAYAFRIKTAQCPALTNVSMFSVEQDFYPGSLECVFESNP